MPAKIDFSYLTPEPHEILKYLWLLTIAAPFWTHLDFFRHAFLATLAKPAWSRNLEKALASAAHQPAERLADDEQFWFSVQQAFTVNPEVMNLNNGGVSPSPKVVQDAMKRNFDFSHGWPSYYMWRILDKGGAVAQGAGTHIGLFRGRVAIHRNASEALETVIFGLSLKAGDEVVLSRFDYPNCINAWKQRELRDGIRLVWVELNLPSEDNEYMAAQYVKAFTKKTKVVHVTHVYNWTGQIVPCG